MSPYSARLRFVPMAVLALLFTPRDVLGATEDECPARAAGRARALMGDILLDLPQGGMRGAPGFTYQSGRPWPGGRMPLRFDPRLTAEERRLVWEACAAWGSGSRVACEPYREEASYLLVTKIPACGCWSELGAGAAPGPRQLNLEPVACWRKGVVVHELGHAWGLAHEHQRPDRDRFVRVYPGNIIAKLRYAFERLPFSDQELSEMGPYDLRSIMHYGAYNGSANGGRAMWPLSPGEDGAKMGAGRLDGQGRALGLPTAEDLRVLDRIYSGRD